MLRMQYQQQVKSARVERRIVLSLQHEEEVLRQRQVLLRMAYMQRASVLSVAQHIVRIRYYRREFRYQLDALAHQIVARSVVRVIVESIELQHAAGEDAALVCELANTHPADKFLVVPHEVGEAEVAQLRALFEGRTALYTDGTVDDGAQVLIVNKVGLLSRLYRYGFMAYVGAGFDGAPHSIIEPAAYGIPVCYGPEFGPVWHCSRMIDAGAGFCVHDAVELCSLYDEMLSSPSRLASAGDAARIYCEDGGGVAEKIAKIID